MGIQGQATLKKFCKDSLRARYTSYIKPYFLGFLTRINVGVAEIYRQKLEQCVADGTLDDEDVKALLRLRVLLCIAQETVDRAHAEICGRLFTKVYYFKPFHAFC